MRHKGQLRFTIYLFFLSKKVSCAKPDTVEVITSPSSHLYVTEEVWRGHGAVDNDYTRVLVHLKSGNKADKMLVLSGEYIHITRAIWQNPSDVSICAGEYGITDSYRNEVTLSAGQDMVNLRLHLREYC